MMAAPTKDDMVFHSTSTGAGLLLPHAFHQLQGQALAGDGSSSVPIDGGSEVISVGYILSLVVGFFFGWFWAALIMFACIKFSGNVS